MITILIDTNVYSGFKSGDPWALAVLQRAERILVCPTVLGELLAGFACGSRPGQNGDELEAFLDTPRVEVVQADETTARFYAEVYRLLREMGKPIPTNDLWIAAAALQHGACLATMDRHFRPIAGLLLSTPE